MFAAEMLDQYFTKYYVNVLAEKLMKKYDFTKEEGVQVARGKYWPFRIKNFQYFRNASEKFSGRKEFTNGIDFINAVLGEGFLWPQQLANEGNWANFLRNSKGEVKKEKNIVIVARNVKKFFLSLEDKTIAESLKSFFYRNDLISQYDNDTLDLTVFCFSKAFKEFSEKEGFIIDFEEEQKKVKRYDKILKKVKEKLGVDYYEIKK